METRHSGSDLGETPVSTIQLRLAAGATGGNVSQSWHKTNYGISFFGINARHISNNQK
ncbi:MAG: hypothetical protein IKH22_05235 [Prevotella sp.]|nr:hypothetical protein [Prevotella sp.]